MQPTQRITIEEINSQPKQIQNHNKKILNLCTCITDTLAHSRVCSKDERWAIIIKLLLYLKTYPNYISNGAKTHKSLYSLWFDRRRAEERERESIKSEHNYLSLLDFYNLSFITLFRYSVASQARKRVSERELKKNYFHIFFAKLHSHHTTQ